MARALVKEVVAIFDAIVMLFLKNLRGRKPPHLVAKDVHGLELEKLMRERRAQLVDLRYHVEARHSVPGAVNIPACEFEATPSKAWERLFSRKREVYVTGLNDVRGLKVGS